MLPGPTIPFRGLPLLPARGHRPRGRRPADLGRHLDARADTPGSAIRGVLRIRASHAAAHDPPRRQARSTATISPGTAPGTRRRPGGTLADIPHSRPRGSSSRAVSGYPLWVPSIRFSECHSRWPTATRSSAGELASRHHYRHGEDGVERRGRLDLRRFSVSLADRGPSPGTEPLVLALMGGTHSTAIHGNATLKWCERENQESCTMPIHDWTRVEAGIFHDFCITPGSRRSGTVSTTGCCPKGITRSLNSTQAGSFPMFWLFTSHRPNLERA